MPRTKQTARKSTGLPPRCSLSPSRLQAYGSIAGARGEQNETPAQRRLMEGFMIRKDWLPLTGGPSGLAKDFEFKSVDEARAYKHKLTLEGWQRRISPKLTLESRTVTVNLPHEDGETGGIKRNIFEFARFADTLAVSLGCVQQRVIS